MIPRNLVFRPVTLANKVNIPFSSNYSLYLSFKSTFMQPSSCLNNMVSASLLGFTYVRFYGEVQPEIPSTVVLCQHSVGVCAQRTMTQCHSPVRVKSPHTLPDSERSNKKTHTRQEKIQTGKQLRLCQPLPLPNTATGPRRVSCLHRSLEVTAHRLTAENTPIIITVVMLLAPFGAANSDSVLLLMLLQPEATTVTMMRVRPAAAAGGPQAGADVWSSLV